MKMLVDAQLPARLANHLRRRGIEVLHTSELPLGNRTTDEELKYLSLTQAYVIVTKDGDFVDNLLLHHNLYKLILISTGNISNNELIELFTNYELEILDSLSKAHFVELTRLGVVVRW
jgi:predicted nuclease of predicted toxin-antitoxin system